MEWESRSHLFGASLRSVLFKGLPNAVNEHLHNWQTGILLKYIERKNGLRILDVGCGYGRLSIPIIEKFPGVDIRGVDISENYIKLYQEHTHHFASIGAIENLPAELGTFDYILCITVLMYLNHVNLEKAVSNLIFHLKPGGRLILIEPHCSGKWFQTGFGIFPFLMKRIRPDTVQTGGRSFRGNEIECYVRHAGGKILSENRLPVTSLFFLPMTLCAITLPHGIVKRIFRIVSRLDALSGVFKWPSIYVAYAITKNE